MGNVLPFRPRTAPAHARPDTPAPAVVPASGSPRDRRPAPLHPTTPGREPLWREAVGETLRARRRDRGERIADVAERAGVSPQYLSELERGRKDPSSEMLAAVAGALGLSVLELAGRVGRAAGPVCLAA